MDIEIFDSAALATDKLSELLVERVQAKKDLKMGLATGRTMDAVYHKFVTKLSEKKVSCINILGLAIDEYIGLAVNDENSYKHYLNFHLYEHLDFVKSNLLVPDVHAEDLDEAALKFEKVVEDIGGVDIQLLGIGTNGHIGFNEPGSAHDSQSRVVGLTSSTLASNKSMFGNNEVPKTAITMGIGTILKAKECILIATGESKASIIQKLVNGDISSKVPASALKLHKNTKIILDREAAKLI